MLSSAALKIGCDVPRLVALSPLLSRWLPHLRGTRTDPAGSREIFELWGWQDRRLRLWPGSRHETLNDLDREAVVAELLDWILARCG